MFGLTGGHKGLQSVECNRFCLQGRPAASNRQQANTVNVASTYVNVPTHRCPEITPWSSVLAPQITNKRSRTAFKMVDRTNSRSSQRSRGSINQWNGLTSLNSKSESWHNPHSLSLPLSQMHKCFLPLQNFFTDVQIQIHGCTFSLYAQKRWCTTVGCVIIIL